MPRRDRREEDDRYDDDRDEPRHRPTSSGPGLVIALGLGAVCVLMAVAGGGWWLMSTRAKVRAENEKAQRVNAELADRQAALAKAEPPKVEPKPAEPKPAEPKVEPKPEPKVEPKPEPPPRWKVGEGCKIDGVLVGVLSTYLEDDEIHVFVKIWVTDKNKKVDYKTWRSPFARPGPTAADDNKNKYKRIVDPITDARILALLARQTDQVATGDGAVYADKPRVDLIRFERPAPGAKTFDIDLPGSHVGVNDTYRFQFEPKDWQEQKK